MPSKDASHLFGQDHVRCYRETERPDVTVQVRGDRFTARARTATADEKPELWLEMLGRFAGYEDYRRKANREIPVVVLEGAVIEEQIRSSGRVKI